MSRPEELPEAATVPPKIVTPEENSWRAALREEVEERRALLGIPSDPADPNDPLRQPGESSSAPRLQASEAEHGVSEHGVRKS